MNTVIKGTKTIAEYKRVREDMENLARANYARHKEAFEEWREGEPMAQQLATVRNEFVRETVNSHERTRYQPNPIYARQANEIESVAKTVAEQSRTIEAFKAERDKLGMFKGKEKKEIQGNT